MQLKNIFLKGTMNKDHDERLVPPNQYIHAENLQVIKSEGSDVGAIENALGNLKLTHKDYGVNAECIGGIADESREFLIWCVKSDTGSYIMQWGPSGTSTILEDTRPEGENVLNFSKDHLITGINIVVDSDSDKTFLLLTDDLNPPRAINIERAKTYGPNNFREEEINLIKRPPLYSPTVTATDHDSEAENNLRDKFLSFSYRYKYLDGEISALGPFTQFAFHPEDFRYDYATGSNEGMVNSFREVELQFNTGDKLVTDIEVVFKESGSNNVYLVESFNKEKEGWGDNVVQTTKFSNNKVTKILPEDELFRLYDNVPLQAKAQEVIGNRLVFGNYVDNYDLIDKDGNPVKVDITVDRRVSPIERDKATKTIKTNRDYEVGVSYIDDYGRMTTVLAGGDNTVHVPVADCTKKSQLDVKINSKPPAFASYYRIFIKQNKDHYNTVVSTNFHSDGIYVWVKMSPTDVNKFKEGDYLVVKADSSGPIDRYVETRVVEVKDQPKNFLEIEDTDNVKQPAGMYYKLRPEGFNLSQQDLDRYEWNVFNSSYQKSIYYQSSYIELPSYYGVQGLNDLSSHGTYTKWDKDIRYLVAIDSVNNRVVNPTTNLEEFYDTFRWSEDGGVKWTEKIRITGGLQDLSNGVQVKFGSATGHNRSDNWVVPAKGERGDTFVDDDGDDRTYLVLKGVDGDTIYGGAEIAFRIEDHETSTVYEASFISSRRYDNLEEWFYGDGIDKKFKDKFDGYWFRRGFASLNEGNRGFFHQNSQLEVRDTGEYSQVLSGGMTGSSRGEMVMLIRSGRADGGVLEDEAKMNGNLSILQSDTHIIFETKEKKVQSDIFYEQSQTYAIINGNHANSGRHILPFFNAYSWGNGFESYKVKDDITENSLGIDTRPLGTISNYRQNKRIASLTYSGVYEQTTNYNALNVFNLATANYKDMDDKFGSIQKIYSRDTNLLVLQEDKVHQVLFNKAVLYNADGTSNVQKSTEVLGDAVPYAGEFGIGKNPESFVAYATWASWVDPVRGKVIKLGGNGLFPISSQGMVSWFRDALRNGDNKKNLGCYDAYMDKVIYCINQTPVVAYDEAAGGWTGFFSYVPEYMLRLGSRFYSFKDGQLYMHNEKSVPRNKFYGVQYKSKVNFAVNQNPSDIKVWKAMGLEGNLPWSILIKAFQSGTENFSQSTITPDEFVKKEGYWYGHFRRNELAEDRSSKSVYGIGLVSDRNGDKLFTPMVNSSVSEGDLIYTEANGLVGVVKEVIGAMIVMDRPVGRVVGEFIYGAKDSRIEGAELRGYTSIIEMENDSTDKLELFAVNTEVFKSHR